MKDKSLVKYWYKVPFRNVYCETFRDWLAQTIYCHIVIRIGTKSKLPDIGGLDYQSKL